MHILGIHHNIKNKKTMYRREIEEISTKQEGGSSPNDTGNNTVSTRPFYPSSTSSWSKSGDPRIVRVPKEFGGKDRHSKVCTVRGLRDRRVRLSVPTAIQVYHLQARLGLDQPSKVVDWLLNAAKDDIDELPPLQIPPGVFIPQNLEDLMSNTYKDMVQEKRGYVEEGGESSKCLESLMNNSNNNSMTYNSLIRWDASNLLSLSHASQPPDEDHQYHNFHASNHMPTGLSLYPSQGLDHQSYFSSNDNVSVEDFEGTKHFGFQMLSSNSFNHHQQASQHQEQNVRPFHFSMMDNRERETSNESEYDCSR